MAFCILSGTTWVSRYQKKHSLTHTHRGHQSSLICFLHLLRSMASSLFNLRAWQSFSTISHQVFLVCFLAWHLPLYTPYTSSPNHCLIFSVHAHTIATCFSVVPRLWHLILVFLNPLLGTLSCSLTPHIRLTILVSAHWSATSFSFLTGLVSRNFVALRKSGSPSKNTMSDFVLELAKYPKSSPKPLNSPKWGSRKRIEICAKFHRLYRKSWSPSKSDFAPEVAK